MREDPERKSLLLKITNQFRAKGGMAYDLKCEGVRLTLTVTARTRDDEPAEWCIAARGARTPERVVVMPEWGATRADALRAIGRAWSDTLDTLDLRVFDWDAVASVLSSVRAI